MYSLYHVIYLLATQAEGYSARPQMSGRVRTNDRAAKYKLWDNAYHEILNETFRYHVYEYIADWLDKALEKGNIKQNKE